MLNIQLPSFIKKPNFLLALLLAVFFLKGVFLAVLFPMFKGQDESRHYNTIQYLAEPQEKNWEIIDTRNPENKIAQDKERLETYRFSQEIKETIRLTDLNIPRQEFFAKNSFTLSAVGENEIQIDSLKGLSYNQTYPPDILRSQNFYHRLVLPLEKFFAQENIFVRFYLIRIFSVLLGTLIIFLFYQIIKSAGFSIKNSLLLTSLAVFQPKFSTYLSNINYDALLILAFALFTLAGIWVLKNGFGWKNGSLLLSALALGLLAKGTSIALLLMLLFLIAYQIYKIYQKTADKKKALIYIFTLLFLLILVLWLFSAKYNIFSLLPIQENLSLKENILSFIWAS